MKDNILNKIFNLNKPIIGMLHLDILLGSPEYKGLDYVVNKAKKDIDALQRGGINGILIENWKENSIGPFVQQETTASFAVVAYELSKYIKVPFGINVLNNDYKTALAVAALTNASFIQMDVFVDYVKSNFTFSQKGKKTPFKIKVDPKDVHNYARRLGLEKIPIFVFIQPKHYKMLEKNKTIEESTKQAFKEGAAGVLITKSTGFEPSLELIKKAKSVAGNMPVGIGSGLSIENAKEYLSIADFAIVGTSIKVNGITNNPVDKERVKKLMKAVSSTR